MGVKRPGLVLLVLPATALLALFARERRQRLEHAVTLSDAYRGTALLLGDVLEGDDAYTGNHSRAVLDLAVSVCEALGLTDTQRQNVEFAALLHDVGKIRVPKEIIHKVGPLNDDEWKVMHRHTIEGELMLRQVGGVLAAVGAVVRSSHEHYDGRGYPDRLTGAAIPIGARIISVCDAYSAMTTDAPTAGAPIGVALAIGLSGTVRPQVVQRAARDSIGSVRVSGGGHAQEAADHVGGARHLTLAPVARQVGRLDPAKTKNHKPSSSSATDTEQTITTSRTVLGRLLPRSPRMLFIHGSCTFTVGVVWVTSP